MSKVMFFIIFYLLLILVVSILAPRVHASFKTEKGIFRLHLLSVGLFASGLFIYLYFSPNEERTAVVFGALAAHAILSISFLELWSLSEGGYSVQMLLNMRTREVDRDLMIDNFTKLGDEKRENRLGSLVRLGLIRVNNRELKLTSRGKIIAVALKMLLALANIKGNA